jgi:hypothetical protein
MYINIHKAIYDIIFQLLGYLGEYLILFVLLYIKNMLENVNLVIYSVIGFAISYLSLEVTWHITACRMSGEPIKPCLFKIVKTVVLNRL